MAMAIISQPQSRANLLREFLQWDPAVRRAGLRFLHVRGTESRLCVTVRQGRRTLRLERGREWRALPLDRLKASCRGQILGWLGLSPGWWRAGCGPRRFGERGGPPRIAAVRTGPAVHRGRR